MAAYYYHPMGLRPAPKPRSGDILWPTASQPWVNALRKMHFQPRRGDIRSNRLPDVAPTGLKRYLPCRRSHGWLAVG